MGAQSDRFAGKVVLISGVARGQGRQHAVDFAAEGASVIGFDVCADLDGSLIPLATPEDLAETVRLVEAAGGEIHAAEADVREFEAVRSVVEAGVERFGRLDFVIGNAGILAPTAPFWELTPEAWHETIAINLSGVWHTAKAAAPALIAGEGERSIVVIGSTAATKGWENIGHYVSAKHGLVGLMRTMALELAPHGVRVNMVSPTNTDTPMFVNENQKKLFAPHLEEPTVEDFELAARAMNLLPVGWIEPADVSAAIRWLVSAEARYVTGAIIPVDAGCAIK